MPPKQATLGKFFHTPHGTKHTAPQQSKLTFSTASSSRSKVTNETKEHVENSTLANEGSDAIVVKHKTGGDVVMVQDASEKVEAQHKEETKVLLKTGISPKLSKRSRKLEVTKHAAGAESDEEPPSKRARTNGNTKAKKAKVDTSSYAESNPSMQKADAAEDLPKKAKMESVALGAEVEIELDMSNKRDQKLSLHKQKYDASESGHNNAGSVEKHISSPLLSEMKPMLTPLADVDEHGDSSEASAADQELEDDSEDDKPESAAKARAKVQSTLTGKSKDPYQDWKPGEPVPYAALCTTFSKIEMTTKRLEIQAHCSLFLRQVLRLTPEDLLPTIQLMINKLAADYTGIELGIGESLIMKAIGETTGRTLAVIKADQNEIGDLGLVAAKSRSNQPTMFKPKSLTVRSVHEGLMAIATVEGQGAQGRKVGGIKKLLSAADAHLLGKGNKGVVDITKDKGGPSEAKFIIRALEGKMRLGLADKTVLISLAQAMVTHEMAQNGKAPTTDQLAKGESTLKSVYSELPSYEVIIPAMLKHGLAKLHDECKLQPGIPLKPMLAKPTKSITEVLDRFEGKHFSCEYKYDGERAQIHFVAHDSSEKYESSALAAGKNEKGTSNIFSRNSEDLSKKYPDILAKLPTWVKEGTKSFVLDCETVGWDVTEKKVLPFQTLMTRKRKDVKVEEIKVKVCVFAFDILFLNGEALVNKPFRERRALMRSAFTEVEGEFAFAKYGDTNELDEIQTLLEESVKASCEGLMVKMLDGMESNYEPSRRSQNWLKVKKDYLSGVGDSLDLVVLGAYFGKGKRTSVYGAFLLACYNPSTDMYETVCNIGTGFSEVVLGSLHEQLSPLIIDRAKPFYSHSSGNKDQPDVWFEATFVWEVLCADLTLSPRYKAAAQQMDGGKGVSLRFPRFLKVRDDKKPDDATTSRAVAEMYRKQEGVAKSKGPAVDDDFEY